MRLVVVAPRFPYPLDKGDRLTVNHLVRHFAQRHQVWLVCFLEPDQDPSWVDYLAPHCEGVVTVPLRRWRAWAGCAIGLAGREPLQVRYYADPAMRRAVRETVRAADADLLYAHTIRMGPYLAGLDLAPRVLAMQVSMTLQYRRSAAEAASLPVRLLHRLEYRRLRAFEGPLARRFDTALLISPHDLRGIEVDPPERVVFSPHGVDVARFSPDPSVDKEPGSVVFSGNMGFAPNVDAAVHFHRDVLPLVRRARPDVRWTIVGASPAPQVRAMAADPGVRVTGRVESLRPHLAAAEVAVDPLRVGAGLQNKVLEAMAMGLPTVVTSIANEGIGAVDGEQVLVADGADAFAEAVVRLLDDPDLRDRLGRSARRLVVDEWTWERHFDALEEVFERLIGEARDRSGPRR